MTSSVELFALSSSLLASSSPSCLFLLSVTLTVINFALLCSTRARKQSLKLIAVAGNLLLVFLLALVVLGLPFGESVSRSLQLSSWFLCIGFLYLAFQGLLWLLDSVADTIPAVKNLHNVIVRTFSR